VAVCLYNWIKKDLLSSLIHFYETSMIIQS
jgi:hypothetical protein